MESLTYADTTPYVPPLTTGRVIKIYDGDTITIGTFIENKAYRFSVRMRGIDCHEMKGPHADKAKLARDELIALIFHKVVALKNVGYDKYGRILAEVYFNDIHVNAWMLQKEYAVPYFGGKRTVDLKNECDE
jgi:endonuclease YncB( thermonuclease family)